MYITLRSHYFLQFQDTLFLRPASPKRSLNNGDVASERPHTISTAYEKGHQRPQLQPYTFSPPGTYLHTRPQPFELYYTRKYPLRGNILGVLTHTTALDRLWEGDKILEVWKSKLK